MTSRGHNLVLCMDKRPQKIIIWYSTQTNDLTKVIAWYSTQTNDLKRLYSGISTGTNDLTKVISHYPTQKYNLKRTQSGILHGRSQSGIPHKINDLTNRLITSLV